MSTDRPKILSMLSAMALLLFALTVSAQAPNYPTRLIRLVVPSSPGGSADITARLIAPRLSEQLGQQVVVENRPGAGTMLGGEIVARAPADGYTLLLAASTLAINPAMYKKVAYDALKDFAPISLVVTLPNILVIHPSLPVRTLKELIAFCRTRPNQFDYATAGVGTSPHLSMELFLAMIGLKMTSVPYKGSGQGLVALLSGHVTVMMPSLIAGLPHIKNGRLRALGVTSAQRASGAPDMPTIAELGVAGYESINWLGLLAPANTPRNIVSTLHAKVTTILQNPEIKERFKVDGAEPVGGTPEQLDAFIRTETTKWAKVVQNIGIQPE